MNFYTNRPAKIGVIVVGLVMIALIVSLMSGVASSKSGPNPHNSKVAATYAGKDPVTGEDMYVDDDGNPIEVTVNPDGTANSAGDAVGPDGVLLDKDGNPIPGVNASNIFTPAQLEAIEIFESATKLFPDDSYMVSHVNNATVTDPMQWWSTYTTFIEEGDVNIVDKLPATGVKSITYAAYKSRSSVLSNRHPLSKQIVVTSDVDSAFSVYDEIQSNSSGDFYSSMFLDGEKDRAYVVVATGIERDLVEELGRSLVGEDPVEGSTPLGVKTFDGSGLKENFTVDAKTPRLMLNLGKFAEALTPEGSAEYTQFWGTILDSGIGMKENSVWVGEPSGDPTKWSGRFISGGISANAIDLQKVEVEKWAQYNYDSTLYPTQELLDKAIEELGGAIFDYGYIDPGLAFAIDAGMNITYKKDSVGATVDAYGDREFQTQAIKDDGVLRVKMAPRSLLQGLNFSSRDSMLQYVLLEHNTKTENSTVEFQFYKPGTKK